MLTTPQAKITTALVGAFAVVACAWLPFSPMTLDRTGLRARRHGGWPDGQPLHRHVVG